MSKHTPGPWSISPYDRYSKDIVIVEPGIIVDNDDDVDQIEAAANARLIAAAPDLLEALQKIAGNGDATGRNPQLMCDIARAAIAKATGTD